jgi:transposase-like protein
MSDNVWYSMNGYIATTVNGKPKYQHVIVAEEKLGRELVKGECVHHRDEVKTNNNPGNLIVFSSARDHAKFHQSGLNENTLILLSDGTYQCTGNPLKSFQCQQCNKTFKAQRRKRLNVFCSQKCAKLASRKIERPSIEELIPQLKAEGFEAVSRRLGVSSNAIRKWLKSAGFNPKTLKSF